MNERNWKFGLYCIEVGCFEAMFFKRLLDNLIRKKPQEEWIPDISLKRCLSAIDLISLGVGTTVGTGLYVIIGNLARNASGPSVVLSLLLASNAAFLCGLSFAEYGSRFPDGGSSYMYTYATLGEISAFVVGWNIALEFLLAGASLARTCSELINYASNGTLYAFFSKYLSKDWSIPGKVHFPDLLAAAFVLAVMTILCLGVRSSANFHNAVTVVNLAVIVFMIFVGFFFAHFDYWEFNFASYGFSGVLPGAAQAFFAFSGFDVVAEAAEEVIHPEKNIPKSFLITIIVSTLCYMGVAIILTLMVPSHSLDKYAPLVKAFGQAAFPGAQYIILIGGICATISALFCSVYSTSRVVYSMSVDGLLFKWFSKVHTKTQVPHRATVASGIVTALLALLFDVNELVELQAIGTLLAYTKVTISVLVSRFQPGVQSVPGNESRRANITNFLQKMLSNLNDKPNDKSRITYQLVEDEDSSKQPVPKVTEKTASRAELGVFFLVISLAALAIASILLLEDLYKGNWWTIFLITLFSGATAVSLFVIHLQPRNSATFPFMVPGVPYIPALTIFINAVLMVNLKRKTYLRFGVWMILGFVIYLCYGYKHSTEAVKPDNQKDEDTAVLQETPEIEHKITHPQLKLS